MSKALKEAISAAAKGRKYPVLNIVRQDPEHAAILSKLIRPPIEPHRYTPKGDLQTSEPNYWEMRQVSQNVSRRIRDAENVLDVLPETELAGRMLIALILAPKDMMNGKLTYSAPPGSLPPDVATAMVKRLRDYFETDYKIEPLLPKILADMILYTGSYPVAVIPENAIDEIINDTSKPLTLESLSSHFDRDAQIRPRNLLRNPDKKSHPTGPALESDGLYTRKRVEPYKPLITLESEFDKPVDTSTTVIDNPNLLKVPLINQRVRQEMVLESLGGIALERETRMDRLSDRELSNLTYKGPRRRFKPIDSIKTQERLNRRTVGSPLVMHLPSESVLPVFIPGNEDQHVGYFVLLDENGNPLVRVGEAELMDQISLRMTGGTGGNFTSAMLNKVKANISGFDCCNRQHLNLSARLYGEMIEKDLLSRLRNGGYANGVAIASRLEVYRLMLSRALAAQRTQILFLPIEIMTYFAFKYDADGIGKSVLDEMAILSSMRAMLTYANTMAAVKNSISKTKVDIKLDEVDPDPLKTIERTMHDVARARQNMFPIGQTSPVDITDYMQRAQYEFAWSGNSKVPDIGVEFTEKSTNFTKVDTELDQDLRKRATQKFGLAPQMLDAAAEAEFSRSVATNNIMVSKHVMNLQGAFTPLIVDHTRKVAMNDEGLIRSLRHILEVNYEQLAKYYDDAENFKNQFRIEKEVIPEQARKEFIVRELLHEFVTNFDVSLPSPDSISVAQKLEEFKNYMEAVDYGIDFYVSTDILNSTTMGDISENVDVIKSCYRAYFARKWMAENGFMTELSEIVEKDVEGKPIVRLNEIHAAHIEGMTASINDFLDKIVPTKKAANKAEQARQEADTTEGGAEPTTSEETGGGDTGGGSDDLGGDLFGSDTLGGDTQTDLDLGGSQEQTGEEGSGTEGGEGTGSGEASPL